MRTRAQQLDFVIDIRSRAVAIRSSSNCTQLQISRSFNSQVVHIYPLQSWPPSGAMHRPQRTRVAGRNSARSFVHARVYMHIAIDCKHMYVAAETFMINGSCLALVYACYWVRACIIDHGPCLGLRLDLHLYFLICVDDDICMVAKDVDHLR